MPGSTFDEKRHFVSSVGSSSDDCDKSEGPPIVINHDRYNFLDGLPRLHLI